MSESDDRAAIDRLIAQFFAAFDNRGGRVPSTGALATLFAPGAIVVCDKGSHCEHYTIAEFIAPRARLLTSGELVEFHEWETESTTHIVGAVATRASRYRKQGTRHAQPYGGGGAKFFHFGRFAQGWRISAVAWSDFAD